jgi:hypothetical protein
MNPYCNLPPEQRMTQRLVDQFSADERLSARSTACCETRTGVIGARFVSRSAFKPMRIYTQRQKSHRVRARGAETYDAHYRKKMRLQPL